MSAGIIDVVTMPKWGLSMSEGKVVGWIKNEGEPFDKGDEIVEVETEKIVSAVEAPVSGMLRKIVADDDTIYPVGGLLGVIADDSVSDDEVDAFIEKFQAEFVPPDDEEEEETASAEFLDAGGYNFRYLSKGVGEETIILIHGFGGDLDNWLFNHDELADKSGMRVIALDLPGHGQTTKKVADEKISGLAESVYELALALEVKQAHLVGHSMGGAIALAMAKNHPDFVLSIGLIASAGLGPEINANYLNGFIESNTRKEIKPVLQQLFTNEELVTRQMIDNILQYKRLDGVNEALQKIAAGFIRDGSQTSLFGDVINECSGAVNVVWGNQDQVIPVKHVESLPKSVKVEVIDSAGHMVQMEAAGAVNRILLDMVMVQRGSV